MKPTPQANWGVARLALGILALDQLTKLIVLRYLGVEDQRIVIDGFFKFVHWRNTGAAFSMWTGNNGLLAVFAVVALLALILTRHHFGIHTRGGRACLGLILGGIAGNLVDRVLPSRQHVIDFLYFYLKRRDGSEAGFPAFNVADSAICIGVGLLFVLSWRGWPAPSTPAPAAPPPR
ncbi:MAG: lipoprotein signal peptidase [Verrucomicrobiota bacterium]|jgi:signal peptidase II